MEVGGRGLVAVTPLSAGAELLSVPRRLLLSLDAAAELRSLPLRPAAILAVQLLREAALQEASFYSAYIRSLPPTFSDGGSFSCAEIAALQIPHAVAEVDALRCQRLDDYKAARDVLASLPDSLRSFASFCWAASTVATRTVSLEPGDEIGALCPLGDMLNHAFRDGPAGYGAFDTASQSYRFYSNCSLAAGAQAFVTYGSYTDLGLLAHYGFVLGPGCNTADIARLPRTSIDLPLADDQLFLSCSGKPGWMLLCSLRLACASPQQRRRNGHLAAAGLPIDPISEARAQEKLLKACRSILHELPTRRHEDEVLLSTLPVGSRMALAVCWRANYKRTLELACQVLATA